ncbi:hypothetical protein FRX31_017135 [Thalictrum thalictroides]|uniref:Uncharacterized protein n=1 Tax=Thalictrum thalictroides TaxID=46969 RepID=A0A7J6W789_THATH|nr:hypothetical protein FRX31_017135 [Thalictrum thalictroides]
MTHNLAVAIVAHNLPPAHASSSAAWLSFAFFFMFYWVSNMICVENFSDIPIALRNEGKTITWGKVIGLFSGGGSGSSTGFSTKVGSNLERFKVDERVGIRSLAASYLECEFCMNSQENYYESATKSNLHSMAFSRMER